MQIELIAIGTKMPAWVNTAWQTYVERLPREWSLSLKELPAQHRGKNAPIEAILADEGERLLKAAANAEHIIALDRGGRNISSMDLAKTTENWLQQRTHVAILVGGPEGLSPACLKAANQCWSLSALTYPHPIVRVVLAEQIFRAWSILNNHPYHR